MNKRVKSVILFLGLPLISFYLGYFVTDMEYKKFIYSFKSIRQDFEFSNVSSNTVLTRPLLGTDSDDSTTIGIYSDLKKQIQKEAEKRVSSGKLVNYGVYFRSLTYPLWFGLNEDEYYVPASLQKLPIAIAVYKEIEIGGLKQDKEIVFTEEIAKKSKVDPLYLPTKLVKGESYSVKELVKYLIVDSDNGAKDLLVSVISPKTLQQTFKLATTDDVLHISEVSPRIYSFYFRILYNSTYISEESSTELLSLLIDASYKKALMAGIPDNLKVAHKYGLYTDESNGSFSLHDCGIFYYTKDPYIFCVMTKGYSVEELESFISTISGFVYRYQK